jgi:hypothetical protein
MNNYLFPSSFVRFKMSHNKFVFFPFSPPSHSSFSYTLITFSFPKNYYYRQLWLDTLENVIFRPAQ